LPLLLLYPTVPFLSLYQACSGFSSPDKAFYYCKLAITVAAFLSAVRLQKHPAVAKLLPLPYT